MRSENTSFAPIFPNSGSFRILCSASVDADSSPYKSHRKARYYDYFPPQGSQGRQPFLKELNRCLVNGAHHGGEQQSFLLLESEPLESQRRLTIMKGNKYRGSAALMRDSELCTVRERHPAHSIEGVVCERVQ